MADAARTSGVDFTPHIGFMLNTATNPVAGRPTMRARWEAGVADATATLRAAPWLAPARRQLGVRSFDVGFYKNAPRAAE